MLGRTYSALKSRSLVSGSVTSPMRKHSAAIRMGYQSPA